jgi:NTE family protein
MTSRSGVFVRIAAALAVVLVVASCAYPTRNLPITDSSDIPIRSNYGYRWSGLRHKPPADTLVIVTASGGGTRAATLELSVLEALAKIKLKAGGTLADRIDILSSVSGGSVTAAYFALKGTDGFPALERFAHGDGVGSILWSGLNPVGLARISTPHTERIDLLIDYFDKTLFRDRQTADDPTFGDLIRADHRPFLILNAGDMVEGVPFAFTQSNFDLLCSDMGPMKLSAAVAASAAFPVALSPVTLTDYSHCAAQPDGADGTAWLPRDARDDVATDWNINPERAMRGRVEQAYAHADRSSGRQKGYIHLLDGGIADNLAVAEPYRMLTTNTSQSNFLEDIEDGNYRKIVFILINARSFASSSLDSQHATPGLVDMLLGTISSSIDRQSSGAAARLRDALNTDFAAKERDRRAAAAAQTDPAIAAALSAKADNLKAIVANSHLIEIDFDAIKDPACRAKYHDIATSWTNSRNEIDSLLLVGQALLTESDEYDRALAAVGGHYDGTPPSMQQACDSLIGGGK